MKWPVNRCKVRLHKREPEVFLRKEKIAEGKSYIDETENES